MKTLFARQDPVICLAPDLFRSIAPGERETGKLNAAYATKTHKFEFTSDELLGAPELRVLQGLVALAGINEQKFIDKAPKSEIGVSLRSGLGITDEKDNQLAVVINASFKQLAKEIGLSDADDDSKYLRLSLRRLWKVNVLVKVGDVEIGGKILSFYASRAKRGAEEALLSVALNPQITRVILGHERHIRIDMTEVRALKTDAARLIHQRLCGWINQGESNQICLDKLTGYVYPNEAKGSAKRMRSLRVRKAMDELRSLGWVITESLGNVFRIRRPAMRKTLAA